MRPLLTALLVGSLGSIAAAQCSKPKIPFSGLPTATSLNAAVTYSDGYKTLANLTYPNATRPSCGWPLIVHVHGYGGKRSIQRALAAQGYAVVTYDVRGQGDAKGLNPANRGMTFYGATEKYDLAEIIAFARKNWSNLVSQSVVGVTGGSQGGIHAWFAAAYSGRKITINGRGTIIFPTIQAAVPQNFVPDAQQHSLRGGTLFAIDAMNRIFGGNRGAVLDSTLVSQFRTFFLRQDPVGLGKLYSSEAGRPVLPGLLTTKVPILYNHAWLDNIATPLLGIQAMEQMTNSGPLRAMLSTIGHGSPGNGYEFRFREQLRVRWFDRFLWNKQNGVDREAPAVAGVVPTDRTITNANSLWQHRFDRAWRAGDLQSERKFLLGNGQLGNTATNGNDTTINHNVPSNYTPQVFASNIQQLTTSVILRNVPMSQRVFSMAALTSQRELGGRPQISLQVVPSATRFHLTALLMARLPGAPRDVMLSSWGKGVIGATANQPMRLSFEMSSAYAVLPRGTILRVILRNHWMRELPMQPRIITAPYFVTCQTKVRHRTGQNASYIDLPFRRAVRPGLITSATRNRATQPFNTSFAVRGGVARAGKPYLILASLSGQVPGTPLPGGILPLNWDDATNFTLSLALANSPLTPGFLGTLNASGNASGRAAWASLRPAPIGLTGLRVTFAAWIYSSPTNLIGKPTNPVDIEFF